MGSDMLRVRVRIAPWAVQAGMPLPADDESFDSYWRRVGVEDGVIEMAVLGLRDDNADCANERMNTYLIRKMPDAFERHVLSRAKRHRVRKA